MVILIANALVETLVKHMFKKYLDSRDKIEIGGAPSWFYEEVDDKICTFAFKKGDYEVLDILKDKVRYKMKKKIDDLIEVVIYENTKNIQNEKERAFVDKFSKDKRLPTFIKMNISYRISYENEISTGFARGCISKDVFLNYQKERMQKIKKELTKFKANNAFDELENATKGNKSKDPNDPFSELDF